MRLKGSLLIGLYTLRRSREGKSLTCHEYIVRSNRVWYNCGHMSEKIIDLARVERTVATIDKIASMIVAGETQEAISAVREAVTDEAWAEFETYQRAKLAHLQRKRRNRRDERVLQQLNLPNKLDQVRRGRLVQFNR